MIIVIISAFLASFVTFFTGFGLGTALMPILAIFFPLKLAVGFTAIVHLFHNGIKALILWKWIHWKTVLYFGASAAFAALFGALLLQWLSTIPPFATYEFWFVKGELSVLHIVVGLLILVFATIEFLQFKILKMENLWLGGLISGFFGGLSGIQGAFRSVFLVANLEKTPFIATSAIISGAVDIARLSVYALTFGHLLAEIQLSLLIGALVGALAGIAAGLLFLPKITIKGIKVAVGILLYFLGILMIMGVI